jgi:hypothetical protein
MSDELESHVQVRSHAADDNYGETLLYDFAKTLTSLSLFVLGGVLSLGGIQRAAEIPLFSLVLTSGSIALAGMLALSTKLIKAANFLLGVGLGGFMIIWLESLK